MDGGALASPLRLLALPLRAAGSVLALARDLAEVPVRLAQLAEAVAALPEIERRLTRIEDAIAAVAPLPEELQRSLVDMPETARQLEAAVARLLALLDDAVGSTARIDGAVTSVDPDLEPAQTAAERVGLLAGRLRVRRRRFARAAG